MSGIKIGGQINNFELNKEVGSKPAPSTKDQSLNKVTYNNVSSANVDENILSKGVKSVLRSVTGEIEHVKQIVDNPSSVAFPDKKNESKRTISATATLGIRG